MIFKAIQEKVLVPLSPHKHLKTSVLRWFFLCPYANEARFSERDGYKKYRTPEADWFSCVFGTVPLQGSFERSEKNPSHRSDWDQIYPLLLSFKQEDLSLQEQFLQPEFRFSLRRFSAGYDLGYGRSRPYASTCVKNSAHFACFASICGVLRRKHYV